MKFITFSLVFLTIIFYSCCKCDCDPQVYQKKLVLQPDSIEGEDATIGNRLDVVNDNFGNSIWLRNSAWTGYNVGSVEQDYRSLLKFTGIDKINLNSKVDSAVITLYSSRDFPFSSGMEGSNASELHLIKEDWEENLVTWNSQPAYSLNFSVIINRNNNFDSISVDVTDLVQELIAYPDEYFGFLIKQIDEDPYSCMIFCSSDFDDASKHPKLEVYYQE